MTLRIDDFEWIGRLVEKNREKHGVEPEEVESALLNSDPLPYVRRVAEDRFLALAQTEQSGEYLFVVFTMPRVHTARVISARRMTAREIIEYRRRRAAKRGK